MDKANSPCRSRMRPRIWSRSDRALIVKPFPGVGMKKV
jgi:hypothetical protein